MGSMTPTPKQRRWRWIIGGGVVLAAIGGVLLLRTGREEEWS